MIASSPGASTTLVCFGSASESRPGDLRKGSFANRELEPQWKKGKMLNQADPFRTVMRYGEWLLAFICQAHGAGPLSRPSAPKPFYVKSNRQHVVNGPCSRGSRLLNMQETTTWPGRALTESGPNRSPPAFQRTRKRAARPRPWRCN